MRLSDLKLGEKATIDSFLDIELSAKLMELGCLPGENVTLEYISPMGCPIAISVLGYKLSIRVQEAKNVILTK